MWSVLLNPKPVLQPLLLYQLISVVRSFTPMGDRATSLKESPAEPKWIYFNGLQVLLKDTL